MLSFEIHDEGYISKKIEVYYAVKNDLETFLSLTDNKYIKPNEV